MNILRRLCRSYLRWRHTRGYGVHSPLAYRIVCDVLQEHDRYYAYPEIDAATRSSERGCGRCMRRARMLHRLASRFPALRAETGENLHPAMKLAVGEAKYSGSHPQASSLIAAQGDEARSVIGRLPEMCTEARNGRVILALFSLTQVEIDELWEGMDCGVLLAGRDAAIAVLDAGVSKVRYTVRL